MKKLLILHGALGAKSQFESLAKELSTSFDVEILEFEGHGCTVLNHDFSIDRFADQLDETISKMDQKPLVFGYSMGGYVALKYGSKKTQAIDKLVTLGTKFDWNEESSLKEASQLNSEKIEEKVPAFANYLKQLHGETAWKDLLKNTASMMVAMGKNPPLVQSDFHQVEFPVVLMRGTEDVMVTASETLAVQQELRSASYEEKEGWKHPIDRVPVVELAEVLKQKFGGNEG